MIEILLRVRVIGSSARLSTAVQRAARAASAWRVVAWESVEASEPGFGDASVIAASCSALARFKCTRSLAGTRRTASR